MDKQQQKLLPEYSRPTGSADNETSFEVQYQSVQSQGTQMGGGNGGTQIKQITNNNLFSESP